MNRLLKFMADVNLFRSLTPGWLKSFIRRHWPTLTYDKHVWARNDPFDQIPSISKFDAEVPFKLGIIREFARSHQHYVAACRELKVRYELVDISDDEWIKNVRRSDCDAFLVWPSPVLTIWKEMYDERIKILQEDLGKTVYPSYNEVWLYESKRRTRDWLIAHQIPHPRTWVFYDLDQALEAVNKADYPLLIKSNFGGCSHGVRVLRSISQAKRRIRKAFNRGIVVDRADARDRQWGHVILQEYVPHVREWRMVRIGDTYFCRLKRKVGDFASGADAIDWAKPNDDLLDLIHHITMRGNFTSMNADVFETEDGRYLVNELHPFFGAISAKNEARKGEHMGRYTYDDGTKQWIFESGYFYQNACANLRVEYLIKTLSTTLCYQK